MAKALLIDRGALEPSKHDQGLTARGLIFSLWTLCHQNGYRCVVAGAATEDRIVATLKGEGIPVECIDEIASYDSVEETIYIVADDSVCSMPEGVTSFSIGSGEQPLAWPDVVHVLLAPDRVANVTRKTKETAIAVEVNLDGQGVASMQTGIGFFDHMLEQIARHSGCDISINCVGDLHIDEHHSIEDTGLALGEAFQKALGDKRGAQRYGFLLPMDESLAEVALDFSGRSVLVWNAEFTRERVGEMPTEMCEHFFKSFCDTAGCTLHIRVEGKNDHHKIEGIFKAFAKCVGQAVRRDPNSQQIPSTKGVL